MSTESVSAAQPTNVSRSAQPGNPLAGQTTGAGRHQSVGMSRGRWVLVVQMAAPVLAGLLVAVAVSVDPRFAGVVLALWLVANFHSGGQAVRPGLPHLETCVRAAVLPFAGVAVGVTIGLVHHTQLTSAGLVLGTSTSVLLLSTIVLRRVLAPVRLLVVGDRMAIRQAEQAWAGRRNAQVVGALLIEPEVVHDLATATPAVTPLEGLDGVAGWAAAHRADVVVVSPGPGITSDDVRRLSWSLEGTSVALAVRGVLDSVAPHRIESTTLEASTLTQIRSSRPSVLIRLSKAVVDRLLGGLLLLLVSPLLAAVLVAIRLDSRGPAFFTQVRVGLDGRHFTMFKLRTMCVEAEALKPQLAHQDEGNGVLFKIANDPRVTRVGKVLRKTSLDELPQLINVVKGDMSLIGPRPALPDEVARYDDLARRRLAVRPGITGLWQISGRSNLSWDESVRLDVRYADNWRLVDDVVILLRTPDAVVRSRGAY